MDIRADIRAKYRESFAATGDRLHAFSETADRFADVAGYMPSIELLDRLLRGALLGEGHVLMQLLKTPAPQEQG